MASSVILAVGARDLDGMGGPLFGVSTLGLAVGLADLCVTIAARQMPPKAEALLRRVHLGFNTPQAPGLSLVGTF